MQGKSPFTGIKVPSSGGSFDVNNTSIGGILSQLLPYVFALSGIILLIYLVLAGLQMMTSRGDPKAMQVAQGKITYSLIGFIIIFLSYSLVKLIGQVLGVTIFSQIFK